MPRLGPSLLFAALLACAGAAHAQQVAPAAPAPLNIHAPRRGKLSPAQLQAVATDIHALEANPLADGADRGRRDLMQWVIDSPDVTIQACDEVMEPLAQSRSQYHDLLLLQLMLSSAAYIVEHPDQADDLARVTAGGLRGALTAYAALKAQEGDRAADDYMEQLATLDASGGLDARAAELTARCK